jgi:cysteine desulfuration protein SufE
MLAPHPFGYEITESSLIETFSGFRLWEDRYRQLVMLAKALPPLDAALKTPSIELSYLQFSSPPSREKRRKKS